MTLPYPEPPHLTVAVWSDQPEAGTFSALCDLVQRHGAVPLNQVQLVPWDRAFEWVSDLADVGQVAQVGAARFAALVADPDGRPDPAGRPVRAAFTHKTFGTVLVEYLGGSTPRHPMGISLGAGPLGLPMELWTRTDRGRAAKLARWCVAVLQEVTETVPVRYGAIGVEFTLAVPADLASESLGMTTEVFVGAGLLDADPGLEPALRELFAGGAVLRWDTGLFGSGWAPFNEQHATVPDPAKVRRGCGRLLARAVNRR